MLAEEDDDGDGDGDGNGDSVVVAVYADLTAMDFIGQKHCCLIFNQVIVLLTNYRPIRSVNLLVGKL